MRERSWNEQVRSITKRSCICLRRPMECPWRNLRFHPSCPAHSGPGSMTCLWAQCSSGANCCVPSPPTPHHSLFGLGTIVWLSCDPLMASLNPGKEACILGKTGQTVLKIGRGEVTLPFQTIFLCRLLSTQTVNSKKETQDLNLISNHLF